MVLEIDVAEGRSSSDLIKAATVAMGLTLRAGWRAVVVVPVGEALGVEVVQPWWEPLLSSLTSLQRGVHQQLVEAPPPRIVGRFNFRSPALAGVGP